MGVWVSGWVGVLVYGWTGAVLVCLIDEWCQLMGDSTFHLAALCIFGAFLIRRLISLSGPNLRILPSMAVTVCGWSWNKNAAKSPPHFQWNLLLSIPWVEGGMLSRSPINWPRLLRHSLVNQPLHRVAAHWIPGFLMPGFLSLGRGRVGELSDPWGDPQGPYGYPQGPCGSPPEARIGHTDPIGVADQSPRRPKVWFCFWTLHI